MHVLQQKFKLPTGQRRRILCERRKARYNRQLLQDRTYPSNISLEEDMSVLEKTWRRLKGAFVYLVRQLRIPKQ